MQSNKFTKPFIALTALLTLGLVLVSAVFAAPLQENFDGVVAPAIPPGWSVPGFGIDANASNCPANGDVFTPFTNTASTADTAPNAMFITAPACRSEGGFHSPQFTVTTTNATMTFRHAFCLEQADDDIAFDAAMLMLSNDGSSYFFMPTMGASFGLGGYTHTSIGGTNPRAGGIDSWSGQSDGTACLAGEPASTYMTTRVDLPPALLGEDIGFMWLRTTDGSIGRAGWRVDTVSSTGLHNVVMPADCSLFGSVTKDGTSGNDVITVTENAPTTVRVNGLAGNDTIRVTGTARVCVDAGDGNDTVIGGPGNDFIFGGNGNDNLRGGGGNDGIDGGDGGDGILGEAGDDLLVGGLGVDTINGGADNDGCIAETEAGCEV